MERKNPCIMFFMEFSILCNKCTHMAVLIHAVIFSQDEILALSEGRQFEFNEVEKMEREILDQINWQLYPPTPASFTCFLLNFCQSAQVDFMQELIETTRYISELVSCDYFFVGHKSLDIAIASVLYSFELGGVSETTQRCWLDRVQMEMGHLNDKFIKDCKCRLEKIYSIASSTWDLTTKNDNANDDVCHDKNDEDIKLSTTSLPSPGGTNKQRRQTPSPTAVESIKIKRDNILQSATSSQNSVETNGLPCCESMGSNKKKRSSAMHSSDSGDCHKRKRLTVCVSASSISI
mmetsp:Transcript_35098/g.53053  ORF Transcript_35098/g.53053 Transcript_35098/m.53053 type:complete len:292 (+) Transcript_35098:652-1527(+)